MSEPKNEPSLASHGLPFTPAPDGASALEHALALGRAGFRAIFVHAPDGDGCSCGLPHEDRKSIGKHPVARAWQKIATDDEQALRDERARIRFEPNVGIVMGARADGSYVVAVDVDDHERFAALTTQLGPLPPTLTSISGRGYRLLLALPSDAPRDRVKNVTGLAGSPGVDVKARAGQIVVAPSLHANGRRYAWGEHREIAELPAEWLQAMLSPPVRPAWVASYSPQSMREDAKASKRARKYLESATLAESSLVYRAREGGRNSAFYLALCRCLPLAHGVMLLDGHGYVARELSSAARGAGLPEREIASTLASAEKWLRESGAVRLLPHQPAQVDARPSTSSPARYPEPGEIIGIGEAPEFDVGDAPNAPNAPNAPRADDGSLQFISSKGSPASCAENVARMLQRDPTWRGGPRYDRYSLLTLWPDPLPAPIAAHVRLDREIVACDYDAIAAHAREEHELDIGHETAERGARLAAARNASDILSAFAGDLPAWDNQPRLDTWLSAYLGCDDTPYHRATGRAWLRAAMARALAPGLLVDIVPILHGSQQAGKNRAIDILFSGGPACAPWLANLGAWNPGHADTKRLACSRWILHDDEFSARDPKQVDALKSWVSGTIEQWTAKYSNDVSVMRRRALLVCSVNVDTFLTDPTGARRWVVWHVGAIDHIALARDRDQLLSEALASLAGVPDWRNGLDAVQPDHREITDAATAEDGLCGLLWSLVSDGRWCEPAAPHVLSLLLGVAPERQDRAWSTRLGLAVQAIGGRRLRAGKRHMLAYAPPEQ